MGQRSGDCLGGGSKEPVNVSKEMTITLLLAFKKDCEIFAFCWLCFLDHKCWLIQISAPIINEWAFSPQKRVVVVKICRYKDTVDMKALGSTETCVEVH